LGAVSAALLDSADLPGRGHALDDHQGPPLDVAIQPLYPRETVHRRGAAQALERIQIVIEL